MCISSLLVVRATERWTENARNTVTTSKLADASSFINTTFGYLEVLDEEVEREELLN